MNMLPNPAVKRDPRRRRCAPAVGRRLTWFVGPQTTELAYHSVPATDWRFHMNKPVVHLDSEILGGTSVFVGTRVPDKNLFDYLEAGDSLDVVLASFPSATREQAVAALELTREVLAPDAHPA